MAKQNKVQGNLKGLNSRQVREIERLFRRRIESDEIISNQFARELWDKSVEFGRMIGVLLSREGKVEEVIVGTKTILYLPDLGRFRLGVARLRRLRFIVPILSPDRTSLTQDLITDLEKLRFDAVIGVYQSRGQMSAEIAHLMVDRTQEPVVQRVFRDTVQDLGSLELDFREFIQGIEQELSLMEEASKVSGKPLAVLVGVSDQPAALVKTSMSELRELADTAGVEVVDTVIQRRRPDPRSVLGKGKLEEVVLNCLRRSVDMIIFNTELRPTQWRFITNSTELKVLDRSMLILDIFAQRAQSNEGRLQVELAQLKYNLPRLVEKDQGLSRLTGGIGGRGPGETKLEIGRRRSRERITMLEKRITSLEKQRDVRSRRRTQQHIPLVSLVGYTNAGKSTLFNALTKSNVFVEDKLFATLDTTKRRLDLPPYDDAEHIVLSDTVGFIRDLPEELVTAFRATLEELYHASILMHVVDISEGDWQQKMRAVRKIFGEMELDSEQYTEIVVFNKIDKCNAEEIALALSSYEEAVSVSALTRHGFSELLELLKSLLFPVEVVAETL